MPGTESEVISIVIDLRKNIVPPKLHIRLNIIILKKKMDIIYKLIE